MRYLCIHGHFYQPPRENAWLETVELQDSAAPFHDWNERINFECYARNARARIQDDADYIQRIVNNYERISFNFGPTLLTWMEAADPDTLAEIVAADERSRERFGGHGNALAQAHSHLILPLANERDKHTQIRWGLADFEHHFGRPAEGMWLAETAADTATLEALAANGVQFTILAPRQAKRIKKISEEDWHSVHEHSIDTRRAYRCHLPSGRHIDLFFYHGDVSKAVAFEKLLNSGQTFKDRLMGIFHDTHPQLAHIATDGESYGHHHRYGEMALADTLDRVEQDPGVELINYGYFLELHPPEFEVEIHDNSSWSCVHGVERWRSNCGCSAGRAGWNQSWRGPLRDTLDWLRDQLVPIYEVESEDLLRDPWEARDRFIQFLLEKRSPEALRRFINRNCYRELEKDERIQMLRLLEMQRNAMYMFTSCGWFFDEVSGLETNQILQYANRAIYYARQVSGVDLHPEFVERLRKTPSNVYGNAAESYLKYVAPARVDLTRVGMHYAVSSLFEPHPQYYEFFNYIADNEVFERRVAGLQRLVIGRTTVRSKVTTSEKHFSFVALYLGQQNIIGNISLAMSSAVFNEMKQRTTRAFDTTNLGDVIAVMGEYFNSNTFTIWHLFQDEKRKILREITNQSMDRAAIYVREIYNDNYQLMLGMKQSGIPVPQDWKNAVQFVVNADLNQLFGSQKLSVSRMQNIQLEMDRWNVGITDPETFRLRVSERIFREVQRLEHADFRAKDLRRVNDILTIVRNMGHSPDFWKTQNFFYEHRRSAPERNAEWTLEMQRFGDLIRVRTEETELVP